MVAAVRRQLGIKRVGHAGTLDPFATGLLIVLVGRATKLQRFLMQLPKTYTVLAQLGAHSSTGDPTGEVASTGKFPPADPVLPTGQISQRPPIFSAIKVAGVRSYERARRGEQFELPERTVTVYRFEQLWREDDRAAFTIECSAGTYVRSLIADLNDAYCLELRRTQIGPFAVDQADPATVLPLEQVLTFMPAVNLNDSEHRKIIHSGRIDSDTIGPVRLMYEAKLVAVGEGDGKQVKSAVGFN